MAKSKELTDFEKKVKFIKKDWIDLYEDISGIAKRLWFIGFDVAKAIVQTISLWELIGNLPEVLKFGKYIGIVLTWIKKLKILRR